MKGGSMTDAVGAFTELDAATAWSRTCNLLDVSHIALLLTEDVHYASQWVFEEIENRTDYLEYLAGKLEAIRESRSDARAELAETRPYPMYPNPPRPCVVVHQGGKRVATVLFEVDGNRITKIDMCMIPPPGTCALSGECPGLITAYGVFAPKDGEA